MLLLLLFSQLLLLQFIWFLFILRNAVVAFVFVIGVSFNFLFLIYCPQFRMTFLNHFMESLLILSWLAHRCRHFNMYMCLRLHTRFPIDTSELYILVRIEAKCIWTFCKLAIHTYTHIHIHTHTCIYTHTHVDTYIFIYAGQVSYVRKYAPKLLSSSIELLPSSDKLKAPTTTTMSWKVLLKSILNTKIIN